MTSVLIKKEELTVPVNSHGAVNPNSITFNPYAKPFTPSQLYGQSYDGDTGYYHSCSQVMWAYGKGLHDAFAACAIMGSYAMQSLAGFYGHPMNHAKSMTPDRPPGVFEQPNPDPVVPSPCEACAPKARHSKKASQQMVRVKKTAEDIHEEIAKLPITREVSFDRIDKESKDHINAFNPSHWGKAALAEEMNTDVRNDKGLSADHDVTRSEKIGPAAENVRCDGDSVHTATHTSTVAQAVHVNSGSTTQSVCTKGHQLDLYVHSRSQDESFLCIGCAAVCRPFTSFIDDMPSYRCRRCEFVFCHVCYGDGSATECHSQVHSANATDALYQFAGGPRRQVRMKRYSFQRQNVSHDMALSLAADIDARIQLIEVKMKNESLTLQQEKAFIAEIKELKKNIPMLTDTDVPDSSPVPTGVVKSHDVDDIDPDSNSLRIGGPPGLVLQQ